MQKYAKILAKAYLDVSVLTYNTSMTCYFQYFSEMSEKFNFLILYSVAKGVTSRKIVEVHAQSNVGF